MEITSSTSLGEELELIFGIIIFIIDVKWILVRFRILATHGATSRVLLP
jgi:hypothetical protein